MGKRSVTDNPDNQLQRMNKAGCYYVTGSVENEPTIYMDGVASYTSSSDIITLIRVTLVTH